FCLAEGFSEPFLDMALYADDTASVLLNGTEILRTPNPAFQVPTAPENGAFLVDPATLLRAGVNCLTVAVCNQARVVTGFDVAGILTAKNGLCCHRPGRLCGTKWKDLDGDGRRQPGEPGLGDWTIQLRDASGMIVATQKTDADGSYCFLNLDPGAYTVAEVVPPAPRWIATAPPRPHSVQLAPGQEVIGLDFGNLLCPDPDDPFVTYFGRNPNRRPCTYRFSCPSPNEQPFLNACGCGCLPKPCAPELEISKRPSHVGHPIEGYYGIGVSNVGTCPSGSPLVFTDVLPPGLAYAGLASAGTDWSCKQEGGGLDPVTVTCSYGGPALQPGESTALILAVRPGPSAETTQNCASLMAEGGGDEACTARCADAGEDRNVCPPGPNPGERIGTPARDGCTYRWSPASGLSDPNAANPVVKFPLDGGSATYRVDVQCRDCSGTDWITLNQRAVPGSIPLNGKGTGRFCGNTWTFNLSGHTGNGLVWECARKATGPWQTCPGSANHPKYTANAGRRRLWVRARVLCGSSQGSNTVLLDPTPFCR
ncbi:MAG: SdrD B-like domain-containing protein, partial [Thermoanaerobaculia bacterium]